MIKKQYQNVDANKLHQELIDNGINPNAVLTLDDGSCELQFYELNSDLETQVQSIIAIHDPVDYKAIKFNIYNELNELDKDLQRGTEDLIELFITKGIIEETELPIKTVERLNRKKELRNALKEV